MKITKALITISISFRPALNSTWDIFQFDTSEIYRTTDGLRGPEELGDYHTFVRNLIEEAVDITSEDFINSNREFKYTKEDFIFSRSHKILTDQKGIAIGIVYPIFKEKAFYPYAESEDVILSMKNEIEIGNALNGQLVEEIELDVEDEILKNPNLNESDIFKLLPKVEFYFVKYPQEDFDLNLKENK